jgi:RNA polymerase sigma-70 factor (ECF subfamily)
MDRVTPDSADTERLLERVTAGDRLAFEELFARHRAYLRQVVEFRLDSRLRGRVDPSDVVQEAHLEAFRRLPDFLRRRPMPFRLWLRKTAHERLLVARRRHLEAGRRAVPRELPLPDASSMALAQQIMARGPSPLQELDQKEMARRVRQAVAQLSEPDQEILFMRSFEGLSYQEVGYLLEVDPATARKRHGRALLRLTQCLADHGLTESQL